MQTILTGEPRGKGHFGYTGVEKTMMILSHIWGCDYRRSVYFMLDLLSTCIHHSELHFTDN
jgi:hypothetical protein